MYLLRRVAYAMDGAAGERRSSGLWFVSIGAQAVTTSLLSAAVGTFILTWNPTLWPDGEAWLDESAGIASPTSPARASGALVDVPVE